MNSSQGKLGILVGGGPAPGINSAIGAATIKAINSGVEVVGIYDGYQHLIEGSTEYTIPLVIEDVSRIHFHGGSILRTSRANPTRKPEDLQRAVQTLKELGIGYLLTIGGDDTALGSSKIFEAASGDIRVAHIPKTIDNDLPLPGNISTFGFETARHLGTELVRNLMEDSRTTNRWYFIVVMGRTAGHLALGVGKSAGATVTVIPEEFPQGHVTLGDVADVLEGAMLKRRLTAHQHGVAIIAEGVVEKMDAEELEKLPGVKLRRDQYGHIRLEDIPLGPILREEIRRRFADRGESVAIIDRNVGYELRSSPPIGFDIDYTRSLGYAAVRLLLSESADGSPYEGGMVYLQEGRSGVVPFKELRDPKTGRTRVRLVNVDSEYYEVARRLMIRLERADLEDDYTVGKLAEVSNLNVEELRERFSSIV